MPDVIVVGDGPAGLSAALFLAKRGMSVTVFGTDTTPMHRAYLYNYLGIPEILGSEFMRIAREQVARFGAELRAEHVVAVEREGDGFTVVDQQWQRYSCRYLIITTGRNRSLGQQLGLEFEGNCIKVDRDGRTSVPNVYAAGWAARGDKVQAIISAGEGAAAALDILSREAGRDMHDFDVPKA